MSACGSPKLCSKQDDIFDCQHTCRLTIVVRSIVASTASQMTPTVTTNDDSSAHGHGLGFFVSIFSLCVFFWDAKFVLVAIEQ